MLKYKWIGIKTKMLGGMRCKFSKLCGAKLKKRNQMMDMKGHSIVIENPPIYFRL